MSCKEWGPDQQERLSKRFLRQMREAQEEAIRDAAVRIPTPGDTARWHRTMFTNVAPMPYYAGGFRQVDPNRPCLAEDLQVANVAAEPFQTVLAAMDVLFTQLRQWLGDLESKRAQLTPEEEALSIASTIGTTLGAFIKIHPFMNGNGRTSRILWNALLRRLGLPYELSVAQRPGPPYPEVMSAAMRGNYAPAVIWVLVAMAGP